MLADVCGVDVGISYFNGYFLITGVLGVSDDFVSFANFV